MTARIVRDLIRPKVPLAREYARLDIVRLVSRFVLPHYRFDWPNLDWWRDSTFNEYLAKFEELDGCNSSRRWMAYQLMRSASSVPGDTAECGVFKGATSYLICKAFPDRTHVAFDSFEGLSEPHVEDKNQWTKGHFASGLETAQKNLPFGNIEWKKGWIPERFDEAANRKFAFVHIDVDLYQPTRDSVEFFYPRMSPGGIIVCDDYGFSSCPGATKAIDDFLAGKPELLIYPPCGGAFMIKQAY